MTPGRDAGRGAVTPAYRDALLGAAAAPGQAPDPALVRALQRDLRTLGYLASGVDGQLGEATRLAVRRLQHDLLHNDGASTRSDGDAPVAVRAFNRGVTAVTGVVDAATADSLAALRADPRVPLLPCQADPVAGNRQALQAVAGMAGTAAPVPFVLAILKRESGGRHWTVPQRQGEEDGWPTLGLDPDAATPDHVPSRGYGIGQHTLFHHPPRAEELATLVLDPVGNVGTAIADLADKFTHAVLGAGGGADRAVEHRLLPLRPCRYPPGDARRLRACQACAAEVPKLTLAPQTPVYQGAASHYADAHDYPAGTLTGVPDRAAFLCDWPYAVRRYNGDGPDSYAYQARVLSNLLAGVTAEA